MDFGPFETSHRGTLILRQRLAAVLAADIVEYSRLMGADQTGTLKALKVFRAEILRPAISANGGNIIKDMGDGWLAEFASASEAVHCALRLQDALTEKGALQLRIGINIGDVFHDADDIFGDGVNIAARLQTIAVPGGVALSGAAYSVLDGTLAPSFSDAGLHELKNIARSIQVWMHAPSQSGSSDVRTDFAASQRLSRLIIRPVATSGSDHARNELAASISGDLLRLLRSSDWLSPRIDASSRDAEFVFASSLRARGDQLRLEVDLQSALGDKIWESAFDGTMSGSFAWQDEVTLEVAANVFGAITDSERERLLVSSEARLTARECLECALLEFFEVSDDALATSLSYVERAIREDPDLAPAYLQGVRCLLCSLAVGYRNGVREWLPALPDWLEKAAHDPNVRLHLELYRAIWTYMEVRREADLERAIGTILQQAPSDPDILCLAGWAYVWLGEPRRGLECFRKFERFGHFHALNMAMRAGLATAMVQVRREADAVHHARRILRRTRDFAVPFRVLASASAHLGDMDEARYAVSEALRLVPGDTLAALKDRTGFADVEANRHFFDGLSKAGFPGS